MRSLAAAVIIAVSAPGTAPAQALDPRKCDSIVATARVDSIESALYVTASRSDGGYLPAAQSRAIAMNVGAAFVPPRPFELSVFAGPPRMRILRSINADTLPPLRGPSVVGIYRVTARKGDTVSVATVRASLMRGFDSAAVEAIRSSGIIEGLWQPPADDDSMKIDVRLSSDSIVGSIRLISARFPRIRVVDAVPRKGNPDAVFPEEARADSIASGEVVLRLVVGREGMPDLSTVEVIRATDLRFLRAAFDALPSQRFVPASVQGCSVLQVIDYPFSFQIPESPRRY